MTAPKDIQQSIYRLQGNSDFTKVAGWISGLLEEQKDINIDLDGVNAIRGQGKAEILRDLKSCIALNA